MSSRGVQAFLLDAVQRGPKTSTGARDNMADEVLSVMQAVAPGGRRCSTFGSRFSAGSTTLSTLPSRDTTGLSGYSSSRDSGTLGRWGTTGRKFEGAKVGSKLLLSGPVPGLAVRRQARRSSVTRSDPLRWLQTSMQRNSGGRGARARGQRRA